MVIKVYQDKLSGILTESYGPIVIYPSLETQLENCDPRLYMHLSGKITEGKDLVKLQR